MAKNSFNSISLSGNVLSVNGTGYVLDAVSTPTVSTSNSSFVGIGCTDNGNGTCTLMVNGQEITVNGEEYAPSGYTVNIGFRNNLTDTDRCNYTRLYSDYTLSNDGMGIKMLSLSSNNLLATTDGVMYNETVLVPNNKLLLISNGRGETEKSGNVIIESGSATCTGQYSYYGTKSGDVGNLSGYYPITVDGTGIGYAPNFLVYTFTINSDAHIAIDGADWND